MGVDCVGLSGTPFRLISYWKRLGIDSNEQRSVASQVRGWEGFGNKVRWGQVLHPAAVFFALILSSSSTIPIARP